MSLQMPEQDQNDTCQQQQQPMQARGASPNLDLRTSILRQITNDLKEFQHKADTLDRLGVVMNSMPSQLTVDQNAALDTIAGIVFSSIRRS